MKTTEHRPIPSLKAINEVLDYDPLTGIIINKKTGKPISAPSNGRPKIYINKQMWNVTRLLWKMVTGDDPTDKVIDHIDGQPLNHVFSNLRICTRAENLANRKTPKSSKTGLKGVTICKKTNKYRAFCSHKYLGSFTDPKEAHRAYINAAMKMHGQFARFD
jgi:hypothetical protein